MYKNLRMLILAATLLPCQGMAAINPSFGFPDASDIQITKKSELVPLGGYTYDQWDCKGMAQVNGEQEPVFGQFSIRVGEHYNPQEIPQISHLLKTEERLDGGRIERTGVYELAPRRDGIQYSK